VPPAFTRCSGGFGSLPRRNNSASTAVPAGKTQIEESVATALPISGGGELRISISPSWFSS
jgi:hypothetical protein